MTRSRALATLAAAGVAAAFTVGAASPASAAEGPAITITSPTGGAVFTGDPVISGNASMPGSLDRITNIKVSLTSPVASGLPGPCDPCNSGNGSNESFAVSPSLAYNGLYHVHVTATGSQFLLGVLSGEASSEATASFRMEVKPAEPAGLKADTSPDQSVRVTWSRNTEPDMIAYRLQRKDPGASFHDVGGAVAQPSGGATVSIVDPATVQAGGTFVYQLQAIRAGRSGDSSTAVGSGFSTTQVVVAAPGAPPSGTPPPGSPPSGTDGSAAPTANLSAFLRGSGGSLPKVSLPSGVSVPDGGFDENLPFAIPPPPAGRARNEALGVSVSSSGKAGRALLIPFAGGLLLCLVAFHVRRLNGWWSAAPVEASLPAPATFAASPGVRVLHDDAWEAPSGPLSGTEASSGPLGGTEASSGPLGGTEAPSGPLGGTEAPSGPLSGTEAPSGPLSGTDQPSELPAPTSFEDWLSGWRADGSEVPHDDGGRAEATERPKQPEGHDDDAKWAPISVVTADTSASGTESDTDVSTEVSEEPRHDPFRGNIFEISGAGAGNHH